MTLTLEVTGPQAAALGPASRKTFEAVGGTIGRLADNAWSLPDPYVSSRHAVIRYRDGTYYIEDTSTNCVFINSPENQLVKGQPYALQSGDWIFIEPYEIRVSITSEVPKATGSPFEGFFGPVPGPHNAPPGVPDAADDPFADIVPAAVAGPQRGLPPSEVFGVPDPVPPAHEEVDPLKALGLESRPTPQNVPSAADLARNSVLSDHYQAPPPIAAPPVTPPRPPAGSALIPDDWDLLGPDDRSQAPRPAPPAPPPPAPRPAPAAHHPPAQPVRPVAPRVPAGPSPGHAVPRPEVRRPAAARADGDLAVVLAGAGLENVPVTPDLARSFGHILRVVVGGVMDILKARQDIKREFRMGMTTFKPADNNPLKFSANVDDALHNLLVKRNQAYLGPVEAFEDAFDDLRHHQMAMLAGVRVAFEMMLAELDPDRLQEEFDRQLKKGALLSAPARLRYWDLYREIIHDMVKDPETSFRELFGEEFAKAYEEQLRRLKAQGPGDKG